MFKEKKISFISTNEHHVISYLSSIKNSIVLICILIVNCIMCVSILRNHDQNKLNVE